MNRKEQKPNNDNMLLDDEEYTSIEEKYYQEFSEIMNDLKSIKVQVSTIRDKINKMKKDRIFSKNHNLR